MLNLKKVAGIILGMNPALYTTSRIYHNDNKQDEEDNNTYVILDYNRDDKLGSKFKITINKDEIIVFLAPNYTEHIKFNNHEEYVEILSLFFDFESKCKSNYEKILDSMVSKNNPKNPWEKFNRNVNDVHNLDEPFMADQFAAPDDRINILREEVMQEQPNPEARPRRAVFGNGILNQMLDDAIAIARE